MANPNVDHIVSQSTNVFAGGLRVGSVQSLTPNESLTFMLIRELDADVAGEIIEIAIGVPSYTLAMSRLKLYQETFFAALGYVIAMIKYKRDNGEFWQYAYETMKRREGDCEDMGILVANILWNNEVPYWRIRLVKGWVDYKEDESYHVWCTYLAEDNNWYVLDGAYWPRESTGLKLKWKDAEKYLSVDASWNSEFSFGGLNK